MRALLWLPAALALSGGMAHAASNTRPVNCDDPSLTHPVNQTVISIKDSYPPLSTLLGEEGNVVVAFTINANGTVSDVTLAQSSGLSRLDEATENAARQLIYTPAKSGGVAIACYHTLLVSWRLTASSPEDAEFRSTENYVVPGRGAWPAGALASGKEGVTAVGLYLTSDGKVLRTRLYRSSGTQELDDAAMAYVQKLKLKPAEVQGNKASSWIGLMVIWSQQPPKLPHPPVATQ